jgi:hypothetical protein
VIISVFVFNITAIFSPVTLQMGPIKKEFLRRVSVPSSNVSSLIPFPLILMWSLSIGFKVLSEAERTATILCNPLLKFRSAASSPSCNKWPAQAP